MKGRTWIGLGILSSLVVTSPAAEFGGFTAVDLRLFAQGAALPGQRSGQAEFSIFAQPEFRLNWNNGSDRFTAIPFVRWDSLDSNRSHGDVRELNWLHQRDAWSLQAGVGKVFWGVAESRHLVDIINQTDFVENINGEEKLGQPLLNLNITRDYGNFSLFYLPMFRERTFPAARGRLRFELPVDTDNPEFGGNSRWHPDWAARWSRTFGKWDVGLSYFNGIGREPRLVPYFPQGNFGPPTALIPTYDVIDQASLDVQAALGSWVLKLEALTRGGQGKRFAAAVAGFEYTLYRVFESAADLGLLLEYQHDGRGNIAPPTVADNDVFFGVRLSVNDTQSTQLLLGASVDLNTQTTMGSVEASRRFGDKWKVEIESRFFRNVDRSDILSGLRRDDYFQIRVMRFF